MVPPDPDASAVDTCAAALRRAIVRRELAPGSRLPPERVLAASLGVNRTTLRVALREVARDGLLSVRQGSGHVVRDFEVAGGPDLAPALVELAREAGDLTHTCAELLRVRRWLAGALLEAIAARRPGPDALAPVVAAIDALAGSADGGSVRAVAQADLDVVRAWVGVAGGGVLALFVNPIGAVLDGLPELAAAMYAEPVTNVVAWRWMVEEVVRAGADGAALPIGAVLDVLHARDRATLGRMPPGGG